MANIKDINSTERLLNVIRGAQLPSSETVDATEDISPKQQNLDKVPVSFPKVFEGKRRFTVGVDINRDYISLAKMAKTSDGRPLLVDQKKIKCGDKIPKGSNEFKNLVKSSLTSFAGSIIDCEIWAMMDATEVNVHHLKIPHVPKKQLENVIYFTAKKENPIDEKEAIFDYEMQGDINDQGIPKHSVMVYSAPRSEVEKVSNMFSSIGINLTGITIAPFAIQNIFRTKWLDMGESTFASLFIGHDYSRIDIYSNNNLMMTRGVKTGISSMLEAIDESLAQASPDKRVNKEQIKKTLRNLFESPGKVSKSEDSLNWTEQDVVDMITPAVERLTRQIERTLEYYASSVGNEKVEKIYISSVMNVFYQPLLNYISEQLGIKTEFFDPLQQKNSSTSGASLPLAERASMVPVIGLSLSDNKYTPNVIFNYVEKNREASRKRLNRGIFATFAAALAVCLIVLAFQVVETNRLGSKQAMLEKELSQFNPLLNKEKINSINEELKSKRQLSRQYAQKYAGMALVGELSALTPENIKLTKVRMAPPVAVVQDPKKGATQQGTTQQGAATIEKDDGVRIEGVVLGDRKKLDDLLAQYVTKLEASPILQGVSIQKSNIVNFRKKEVLKFMINAKIG